MILTGDCRDLMREMGSASVDSIVCDPPYGLAFMGKAWDRGVPGVEFWTEALRVARPGAYLLAFGGTRTYHRLACAIEDAGWELHDCLAWLYGSGFPKHRSKLKPAWEPIIMARRPAPEASPLNIEGCRLPFASIEDEAEAKAKNQHTRYANPGSNRDSYSGDMPPRTDYDAEGRWPANVVLDAEAAAELDAQTGDLAPGNRPANRNTSGVFTAYAQGATGTGARLDSGGASRFFYTAKAGRTERDAGLEHLPPVTFAQSNGGKAAIERGELIEGETPGLNKPKSYRNHHPTVKPIALMRWLCRLVTPAGGVVLDPFAGSGTTGCAAALEGLQFVGCELQPEYAEIARARIAHWARVALDQPIDLFGEVA